FGLVRLGEVAAQPGHHDVDVGQARPGREAGPRLVDAPKRLVSASSSRHPRSMAVIRSARSDHLRPLVLQGNTHSITVGHRLDEDAGIELERILFFNVQSTPSATSTTSATNSWPKAKGLGSGALPAITAASRSQVATVTGRTSASLSPDKRGGATSSHSSRPGPLNVSCRTDVGLLLRNARTHPRTTNRASAARTTRVGERRSGTRHEHPR